MNDLDIFFDKTVPAAKPTLLITNVYTLKQRMDGDAIIKHVIDVYNYRDFDIVSVLKIATHDQRDSTKNGNIFDIASKSTIKFSEEGWLHQIKLDVPLLSLNLHNKHGHFIEMWYSHIRFDVIWNTENVGYGHINKNCDLCSAEIIDVYETSPSRCSHLTFRTFGFKGEA